MNHVAIRAERLSKRFRIGAKQKKYYTLRESLVDSAQASLGYAGNLLRRSRATADERSEEHFWALKDVSFEIEQGDVVGVIGRNGAGKSTLLKILSRITEPSDGHVDIRGRVGSLLEVGTGFHFELTGRENIFLNGAILGMRRKDIERQFDQIVEFAEIDKFVDTPVKHYSTGMYMRLAFGVAAHLEPDILLIDEVLAVGDAAFQAKCLGKLGDVAQRGRTVLFVSHNMGAVRSLCTKGIVIEQGELAFAGDISRCIEEYYRSIGLFQGEGRSEPQCESGRVFGPVSIDGNPGNSIRQDRGCTISTVLNVPQDCGGFSLRCHIEDMRSNLVVCVRQDSTELGMKQALRGGHVINLALPAMWLSPGLYSIRFEVSFRTDYQSVRRGESDKYPLDVSGDAGDSPALLQPEVEWSIERTSSTPSVLAEI